MTDKWMPPEGLDEGGFVRLAVNLARNADEGDPISLRVARGRIQALRKAYPDYRIRVQAW